MSPEHKSQKSNARVSRARRLVKLANKRMDRAARTGNVADAQEQYACRAFFAHDYHTAR